MEPPLRPMAWWAVLGGALAVMIRIWLPDPPPAVTGRFIGIFVAGVVAGVVGGGVIHGSGAGSNPRPGEGIPGARYPSRHCSVRPGPLRRGRGNNARFKRFPNRNGTL